MNNNNNNNRIFIMHFQNYSGNVISRMSNLGFFIKTFSFTYLSILVVFLSIFYNPDNDIDKIIKFLCLFINSLIILFFSIINNYFLRLERWFRNYQEWKIKNYKDFDFEKIIIFKPNKKLKPKWKNSYFSITIFGFYLFIFIISNIFLIFFLF
ncbi:MAG: hypothetical protein TYPL_1910 [Candidatus Tyloplasma litorale]|nr:MAG: hypothetical protein TYPL_1910 [Mycoplasmatales bacterium]